jgi:hypothetical protein
VVFELYQGKGVGAYSLVNVQLVGADAASVLDLLDLIPEEMFDLPYHIILLFPQVGGGAGGEEH